MAPVEVAKARPGGSDGEIDQEDTGPPLAVGVTVLMATPLARVRELGLYVLDDGAALLTWMVTMVVAIPPELLALPV